MGFLLYIVAVIGKIILFPLGFIAGIVKSFHQHHFDTGLKNLDNKFLELAKSIDKYGNVVCGELFNWTMIKKDSKDTFGRIEQTISAVLGHNKKAGTLTQTGVILCNVLHFLDKNHVEKAVETDYYKKSIAGIATKQLK